jgi:hypothetical protein
MQDVGADLLGWPEAIMSSIHGTPVDLSAGVASFGLSGDAHVGDAEPGRTDPIAEFFITSAAIDSARCQRPPDDPGLVGLRHDSPP